MNEKTKQYQGIKKSELNRKKRNSLSVLAACVSIGIITGMTGCGKNVSTNSIESEEILESSTTAIEGSGSMTDDSIFINGNGSEENPYKIENADQLLLFAQSVNDGSHGGYYEKYIELAANIDLKNVEWTPIGNMNDMETHATMFLGTFNGNDFTVSNLDYESKDYNCGAGLFGVNCGVIENLKVENVTVSVSDETSLAIGSVVGYNMGKVDQVSVKNASVTGNNCIGGIIGGNNSTVTNCVAENILVTVIGNNDFSEGLVQNDIAECGGLVIGGSFGGTIDNCSASGTIKAEGIEPVGLGGIGGCLEMMDSITNCTADVIVETQNGGHAIGGLCGYAGTHSNPDICLETEGFSTHSYPCVIKNCNVTISFIAKDATHVGGLVGTGLFYYGEETTFQITDCSVKGSIDGAITPGTITGRSEGCSIESCIFDVMIDGKQGVDEVGKTNCKYESADQ